MLESPVKFSQQILIPYTIRSRGPLPNILPASFTRRAWRFLWWRTKTISSEGRIVFGNSSYSRPCPASQLIRIGQPSFEPVAEYNPASTGCDGGGEYKYIRRSWMMGAYKSWRGLIPR